MLVKPNLEFDLDNFLGFLADERCHRLSDLTETTNLPREKVEEIVKFLARFNFIHFDEANKRMINFKLRNSSSLCNSLETVP